MESRGGSSNSDLENRILELELQLKEAELELKQKEAAEKSKRRGNAVLLTVIAGVIAAIPALYAPILEGRNALELESRQFRCSTLLTAIQTTGQELTADSLLAFADVDCFDREDQNDIKAFFARVSDLRGANLAQANLQNLDLAGIDLREANLQGANLSGSNLAGVNLEDAVYDSATVWPEGFDPQAAGATQY